MIVEMRVEQSKNEGVVILAVRGRLDASTWQEFHDLLMKLFSSGETSFLLDFSELEYISSLGLRALLMAARKKNDINGRIALCGLRPSVREVMDISGFTPLFSVYNNQDEALPTFKT
jgi:anti-anti-sigma factor